MEKIKLENIAKTILSNDLAMQKLCIEVWDCTSLFGNEIKELDDFKNNLFDKNLKEQNVSCVYGLKNYNKICNQIYKKFIPIWKEMRAYYWGNLNENGYNQAVKMWAYMHYHYAGWISEYAERMK